MITEAHFEEANYQAMYLAYYGLMEFAAAAPNKLFSPLQIAVTTFCRPPQGSGSKWVCPVCGKKRGRAWFWTQAVPFRAASLNPNSFFLDVGDFLEPLTPVCSDHPIETWGI